MWPLWMAVLAQFLDCSGGDEGHVNGFLKTSFSTSHVEWQRHLEQHCDNIQEELRLFVPTAEAPKQNLPFRDLILNHASVDLNDVQKVKVNE